MIIDDRDSCYHFHNADIRGDGDMEIGTEKVAIGDTVEVKVNTHDGKIFVQAEVIEVTGLVFTAVLPTGQRKSYAHSSDEWRRAA